MTSTIPSYTPTAENASLQLSAEHINDLPADVLREIFLHLDPRAAALAAATCCTWRVIIVEDLQKSLHPITGNIREICHLCSETDLVEAPARIAVINLLRRIQKRMARALPIDINVAYRLGVRVASILVDRGLGDLDITSLTLPPGLRYIRCEVGPLKDLFKASIHLDNKERNKQLGVACMRACTAGYPYELLAATIELLPSRRSRSFCFRTIALWHISEGRIESAIQPAQFVTDLCDNRDVCFALINAGAFDHASAICEQFYALGDPKFGKYFGDYFTALILLSPTNPKRDVKRATEIAEGVSFQSKRDEIKIFTAIALAWIADDNPDKAIEAAAHLDEPTYLAPELANGGRHRPITPVYQALAHEGFHDAAIHHAVTHMSYEYRDQIFLLIDTNLIAEFFNTPDNRAILRTEDRRFDLYKRLANSNQFDAACLIVQMLEDSSYIVSACCDLIERGRISEAVALSRKIKCESFLQEERVNNGIKNICLALIAAQAYDHIDNFLGKMSRKRSDEQLEPVIIKLIEEGVAELATSLTLKHCKSEWKRFQIYRKLAQHDFIPSALQIFAGIRDETYRDLGRGPIAIAYLRQGEIDEAIAQIGQVQEIHKIYQFIPQFVRLMDCERCFNLIENQEWKHHVYLQLIQNKQWDLVSNLQGQLRYCRHTLKTCQALIEEKQFAVAEALGKSHLQKRREIGVCYLAFIEAGQMDLVEAWTTDVLRAFKLRHPLPSESYTSVTINDIYRALMKEGRLDLADVFQGEISTKEVCVALTDFRPVEEVCARVTSISNEKILRLYCEKLISRGDVAEACEIAQRISNETHLKAICEKLFDRDIDQGCALAARISDEELVKDLCIRLINMRHVIEGLELGDRLTESSHIQKMCNTLYWGVCGKMAWKDLNTARAVINWIERKVEPGSHDVEIADALIRNKHFEQSKKYAERATGLRKDIFEAYVNAGQCHLASAVVPIETLTAANKLKLATSFVDNNFPAQALALYDPLPLADKPAEILRRCASSYCKQGKMREAAMCATYIDNERQVRKIYTALITTGDLSRALMLRDARSALGRPTYWDS